MAIKKMNLAKLSVWIIVVIQIFHFGAGEAFKWFKGGCSNYTFQAKSASYLSWETSRQFCQTTGLGDLVSIESEAEWIFLKNTILKLAIADEYFIGLRKDDRSGEWRWLSGKNTSQTRLPWATREPNGDGKCVTMYKDYQTYYGKYNDLDCTATVKRPGYICEFPVDDCNQEGGDKRCSCYTFENDTPMLWPQAESNCKFHNKHLVVMETEREWEFINKEIQTRKSGKENEWHIGLYRTNGNWTWINGKTVTLNKWQKDKPQNTDFYTLMAKESPKGFKGSFSSIKGDVKKGWICEEETDNCQGVCFIHNPVPTTSTLPGATTSTQWQQNISTVSETNTASDSTLTSSPGAGGSKDDNDNSSTIVIVATSLAAVLFVVLIVLAVILLLRRRKQRGKDDETPPKKSRHQPAQIGQNEYEPVDRVEVAKLLGTPDTNEAEKKIEHVSPSANCEYAVVNKKDKKRKEGDLVYAQLAEFDSANNDKTAQKPPSYEPTVYADVDVMPPEVFNPTSVDSTQPTYANVQTTGV